MIRNGLIVTLQRVRMTNKTREIEENFSQTLTTTKMKKERKKLRRKIRNRNSTRQFA